MTTYELIRELTQQDPNAKVKVFNKETQEYEEVLIKVETDLFHGKEVHIEIEK